MDQENLTPERIAMFTNKSFVFHAQMDVVARNEEIVKTMSDPFFAQTATDASNSSRLPSYSPLREAPLLPQNLVDIRTLSEHVNINKVMEGKVFLCRTITPACKILGIETAVEDPKGETAIRIALYNYSSVSSEAIVGAGVGVGGTDFNKVLPPGLILAVKNPLFDSTMLRCVNPADVEIISGKKMKRIFPGIQWEADIAPYFSDFERIWTGRDEVIGGNLKRLGNESFVDRRWTDALRWYDLALEYIEEGSAYLDILSNKSATFLNMGCYNQALLVSERVLKIHAAHPKAIFRKSKALIGLCRYSQAVDFLREKFQKDSNLLTKDKAWVKLKRLAEDLLQQQHKGEISQEVLAPFVVSCKTQGSKNTDTSAIPELIGPIQRTQIDGKGLGYTATEDIQPGQLIMSSKAFASFAIEPEPDDLHKHNMSINVNTAQNSTSTSAIAIHILEDQLLSQIANKVTFDPKMGEELYGVWGGRRRGRLNLDSETDVDAAAATIGKLGKVDMDRISWIVRMNAFQFDTREFRTACVGGSNGCGLWILPSFFNHSCSEANAVWTPFGTLMIIRAQKHIKRGEEVLIRYINGWYAAPSTRLECFKGHEFTCGCKLCLLESAEDPKLVKEREGILSWLMVLENAGSLNLPRNSHLLTTSLSKLDRLVELRKNHPHLNPCLASPALNSVLDELFTLGRFRECLEWEKKCFRGMETFPSLISDQVFTATKILQNCIQLNDHGLTLKWAEKLRILLIAEYGCVDILGKMYPQVWEDLTDRNVRL